MCDLAFPGSVRWLRQAVVAVQLLKFFLEMAERSVKLIKILITRLNFREML